VPRSTVVLDACLAITFGNARALGVVTEMAAHHVVLAGRAHGEVLRPPASEEVGQAIQSGTLRLACVDPEIEAEQEALVRFDGASRFHGRGEAEVLALAASRGWIVGSDEIAVRRFVRDTLGPDRIAGTMDILRWAVREERMTVGDAVSLLDRLDVGPSLVRQIRASGHEPEDLLRRG